MSYLQRVLPIAVLISFPLAAQSPRYANKLAPYVASPDRVVDRMLEMANIKAGETLIDLGCGDGRILIAAVERYKAKAIGIEISQKLVEQASTRIQREGLTEQARVVQGDLLKADLTKPDIDSILLPEKVRSIRSCGPVWKGSSSPERASCRMTTQFPGGSLPRSIRATGVTLYTSTKCLLRKGAYGGVGLLVLRGCSFCRFWPTVELPFDTPGKKHLRSGA